jgi:uncharacterized hydrophobic protein (TIGR00271 family)
LNKSGLRKIFADRELSSEERRSVLEDLFVFGKQNQVPYLVRMSVLLVLSTIIATAGLLSDSAAVVIGAMLVAPLMNPVMAAAGSVVMGWPKRFYASLWLILAMGIGALLLSSLITLLSPELVFIPEQVMARTRPTYYDLLIALAAGAAGAYTITRKQSSAIPGVAVAVALLPPLASAGILATTGEYDLTVRAVVLFVTNLVAMILSGALAFFAVGVSPTAARKQTASFFKSQISLFVVLTIAVSIPLWYYSDMILFNARYRAAKSEILQNWLKDNQLELTDVEILDEVRTLELTLEGPDPPVTMGELHREIMDTYFKDDPVPLQIKYTWTQKISGVWPQKGQTLEKIAEVTQASIQHLINTNWEWQKTQYDADTAVQPDGDERYILDFNKSGSVRVSADCGSRKGKFTYGTNSLGFEMSKGYFSGCRDNEAMKVFLADLVRARAASLEGHRLRITMAENKGIMFFVEAAK